MLAFIFSGFIMFAFQDIAVGSYVRIRGLEVNGNLAIIMQNKNVPQERSVNLTKATSHSSIIPLETVQSNTGPSFSLFLQTTNYILPISRLSILLLISISVSIGVCRYLRLRKGSYYTEEDAGDTQAGDADTVVLQGRTGHRVERRREWIL